MHQRDRLPGNGWFIRVLHSVLIGIVELDTRDGKSAFVAEVLAGYVGIQQIHNVSSLGRQADRPSFLGDLAYGVLARSEVLEGVGAILTGSGGIDDIAVLGELNVPAGLAGLICIFGTISVAVKEYASGYGPGSVVSEVLAGYIGIVRALQSRSPPAGAVLTQPDCSVSVTV